jgi:hypothetical protein
MTPNPYQSPGPYGPAPVAPAADVARTPFVLAGVGALFASAYWAGMALLRLVGIAAGPLSVMSVFLPVILIALYAVRGVQLLQGDANAARRIVVLHIVGAVAALLQMLPSNGLLVALQGIKVAINLFGAATAYWAWRASQRRPAVSLPLG